ncbi:ABC-2 transporter permease [Paenibacillus albidus]|uniref:ABC-2 transporter permease n=1 Tax=Paenibacillus albidus TaxID=2041023 RepID=UPI001BE5454A|nr:ABC-2 transporter permease [Paenibacillus albidus]MBT2290031.1 ABC-2 transporter permease [Paenibacillus albidus]
MKGLVANNLYSMHDNIKLSLSVALPMAIVPLLAKDASIMAMIVAIQVFIFTSSMGASFQMDETSRWNKWEITMPVTRKTIISAKYISFILLILMGLAISLVTVLLLGLRGEFNFDMLLFGYSYGLQLSISTVAIVYPLILKLGAEKSETLLITAAGLSLGLRLLAWYLLSMSDSTITFRSPVVGQASLAFALVMFVWSYLLSARIHLNKEF